MTTLSIGYISASFSYIFFFNLSKFWKKKEVLGGKKVTRPVSIEEGLWLGEWAIEAQLFSALCSPNSDFSLVSVIQNVSEVFLSASGKVKYQVCSADALSKLLVKFGVTQPAAETS
ncbi:unnamed protein product, partial [Vitis vinifera]